MRGFPMRLTPSERQDVVRAIANAERGDRGEVRLHLEARAQAPCREPGGGASSSG